jgi:hypothetical protein
MADPRSKLSALVDPPLAEPPPLAELHRRAKERRRRTAAGRGALAGVVAMVLIGAGVALVPGEKPATVQTAAPPGSTAATDANTASSSAPATVPLTTFQVDGQQWTMLATRTSEPGVCVTLQPAAGEALNAGCLTPDGRAVQAAGADLRSVSFVYGIVGKEVTQVTMSADGNASRLDILGSASGFPVNLVGTIVPPSVTTVELSASRNGSVERVAVPLPAHARVSGGLGREAPPSPPATTATTTAPAPTQPSPTVAPRPAPDTPVSTVVPPTTVVPGGGQPRRVEPVAGATNLRKHVFQSAAAAGAQSVAVRFWNGVEPCYVLGRVDVAETAGTVTITLWTGSGPGAAGAACIQIAAHYEVLVQLQAPLGTRTVVDGAA